MECGHIQAGMTDNEMQDNTVIIPSTVAKMRSKKVSLYANATDTLFTYWTI